MADGHHALIRYGLVALIVLAAWTGTVRASASLHREARFQSTVKKATGKGLLSAYSLAESASRHVEQLAQVGAMQLALHVISQSQPTYKKHPQSWLAWERVKLSVLASEQNAEALIHAISEIPPSAPQALFSSAYLLAARATVGTKPAQARSYLRRLIWQQTVPSRTLLYDYRRLVVRSYIVQDRFSNASRALNYLARRNHWRNHWRLRLLAAEVALQRGHPRRAIRRLSGMKLPRARPLMLLAELRAGIRVPDQIQAMARRLARTELKKKHRRLAGRLHMVAAAAGKRAGDEEAQLLNLFQALQLDPGDTKPFRITVASLWKTLEEIGTQLGNHDQLLFGAPTAWLSAAKRQQGEKKPMTALALLAAAAGHEKGASRASSLSEFADVLSHQNSGNVLLLSLFSDRQLFPNPEKLPRQVRYRLLSPSLNANRVALASELLNGLHKPPRGVSGPTWELERARVFIMGGNVGSGIAALKNLLAGKKLTHPKAILPVILNLESLQRYRSALSLLIVMMHHQLPAKLGQQVMFWIGKAYDGLGAPGLAAQAYLRAAIYLGPYQFDQWSETARYAAAGALAKAGFYSDARRIYRVLYNVTTNPAEKSLIKHKLAAIGTLIKQRTVSNRNG